MNVGSVFPGKTSWRDMLSFIQGYGPLFVTYVDVDLMLKQICLLIELKYTNVEDYHIKDAYTKAIQIKRHLWSYLEMLEKNEHWF